MMTTRSVGLVSLQLGVQVLVAGLLPGVLEAQPVRHAVSGNVEIGVTKAPLVGTEVRLLAPETTWSRAVRQLAGRPREVVDRTTTDRVGAFRLMAPEAGPYGVEVEDPRGVNQLEILVIGEVELGTWPLVEQRRVPGRVDEGELALQTFGGLEWTPWPADLAIRAIEVWGPSAILPPRPGWGLAPALVGTPGRPPRRCDAQGCLPPPASREVQIVVTSGTEPAPAVVALGPEGWAYGLSDRGGRLDLKVPSGATAVVLWAQDGRRVEVEVPERVARPIRVELPDRIPEVEVALGGLPGPFLVAGGDGWFRHVPTGGSVRLDLAGPTWVRARALGGQGASSSVLDGRASLRSAATGLREMVVVDRAGEPVAGAEVRIGQLGKPGTPGFQLRRLTDLHGRTFVRGLLLDAGGAVVAGGLDARAAGFAPTGVMLEAAAARQTVVLEPAVRARVLVVDGTAEPVVGAEVTARLDGLDPVRAWSDAGGIAQLELPAPKAGSGWTLDISAAGFAPLTLPGIDATTLPIRSEGLPGTDTVDLGTVELDAGHPVEVLTLDQDGHPLGAAEVVAGEDRVALSLAAQGLGDQQLARGVTGADGKVSLGWFREGAEVLVAASHRDRTSASGTARAGAGATHLVLPDLGSLSGSVVDAGGSPIEGVEVIVSGLASGMSIHSGRPVVRRTTDQAGRFEAPGLARGDVMVTASGPGWLRRHLQAKVPSSGALVVQLEPAASVRVEVVDHSGGGIEAARVSVARAAPGGGFPSPWGRTNADGIVELPAVPAGDVVVEVEADGYEPKRLGARIDLGAVPILRVELAGGWRLAGRVVDPSGRGVVAMVSATGGTWERYELVREDGVFDFGSVPAGSIRLLAVGGEEARPVSTSRVIELREDRVDVDLLLEPKGRIEGRLVGVAAAEAAGARVTVFDSSSLPRQSAELAWDGAFRVDGLEADRYRVAVTLEDGRSGSAEVEVGPAETATGVEVRLAPTTRVSGTVLIDGNPAADVQVRAQGPSPTGWRTTDLAGRFELHLVEGSWTLRAHDEHGHAGSWPLEVADADLEVELELGSATVEVHVTSIDGAPIAGADVRVVGVDPAAVRQVRARTGSGGVAIVETGSGPWRVEVSADGYQARYLEHAGEGPLEVVLEPRRRRALRVVAPGPTPTLVMVADPDTSETPVTLVLDPAGRGELQGFGSAQRLVIAADGWAPEVVAVTGRDDIEVALSPRIPVVVDLPEPGPVFVTATNAQGMPWIEVTHWGVRRRRQIEVPGAVLDLSPGVWILEAESVDPRLAGSSLHARVEVTQAGQRVVLGPARIMGTGDQGPD